MAWYDTKRLYSIFWMFLVDHNWKDIFGLIFGFSQTISCRATYRDVIFSFLGDSRQKNVKNARHVRLCLSSPPLVLLNWPHLSSTVRLLYARESDYCIPWQIETTTILVTLIGHVAATHSAAAPFAMSMNIEHLRFFQWWGGMILVCLFTFLMGSPFDCLLS